MGLSRGHYSHTVAAPAPEQVLVPAHQAGADHLDLDRAVVSTDRLSTHGLPRTQPRHLAGTHARSPTPTGEARCSPEEGSQDLDPLGVSPVLTSGLRWSGASLNRSVLAVRRRRTRPVRPSKLKDSARLGHRVGSPEPSHSPEGRSRTHQTMGSNSTPTVSDHFSEPTRAPHPQYRVYRPITRRGRPGTGSGIPLVCCWCVGCST